MNAPPATGALELPPAESESRSRIAVPAALFLAALATMGLAEARGFPPEEILDACNQAGPLLLLAGCAAAGIAALRRDPRQIWAPWPWFLGAYAVYFGFGPLFYAHGDSAAVQASQEIHFTGARDLWRTNLLNVAALFGVAGAWRAARAFLPEAPPGDGPEFDAAGTRRAVVAFLAVGIPVRYLLALPHEFGMIAWVPPESVLQLKVFSALAIVPLALLASREGGGWRWALAALTAAELAVALLTFGKLDVCMVVILLVLGLCLHRFRPGVLVAGIAAVALVYAAITPLVTTARNRIHRETGSHHTAGLGRRLAIARDYLFREREEESRPRAERQAWWSRLNYANMQCLAMDYRDDGRSGQSFENAAYVFVPRLLWPGKPVLTDAGVHFNALVTGRQHTRRAPGIFAEAYWNGGWPLVAAAAAFTGLAFAVQGLFALRHMGARRVAYLPGAFLAIRMALRPDGWFVTDILGTLVLWAGLTAALHFLLLRERRRDAVAGTSPAAAVPGA